MWSAVVWYPWGRRAWSAWYDFPWCGIAGCTLSPKRWKKRHLGGQHLVPETWMAQSQNHRKRHKTTRCSFCIDLFYLTTNLMVIKHTNIYKYEQCTTVGSMPLSQAWDLWKPTGFTDRRCQRCRWRRHLWAVPCSRGMVAICGDGGQANRAMP